MNTAVSVYVLALVLAGIVYVIVAIPFSTFTYNALPSSFLSVLPLSLNTTRPVFTGLSPSVTFAVSVMLSPAFGSV